ncbi:FAD/NAD(P)-binding domain-containing protein [Thozetella sp. PMI_491]|nr:FAD/NAD(P)-binding domain-containing protein [Thozetella sp. PMI_491]
MEHIDLLVVGAGWHGLAMAKTYLEVCPGANVAVMDSSATVGGTWAQERLYTGLKTNNIVGSYEFSDFPLDVERYGMKQGQHIPGEVVHRYLCDFVAHYRLPVRLRAAVTSATLLDTGKWSVRYRIAGEGQTDMAQPETEVIAAKLVLATGLTSEPFIPTFRGQDMFCGPILHSKQLKSRGKEIEAAKTVVVLGGNKSAWDVCYSAARAGSQVHMVMRPSGGGPSRVWPAIVRLFGFFKTSISRLSSTRIWSLLDPAPFGSSWLLRWLLHRTRLGEWICAWFWWHLDRQVDLANGYDNDPRTKPLRPWTSTAWMGNSLGVHNYDTSWLELARQGKIIVHTSEISELSTDAVHLQDGTRIATDMVVCCTGWKAEPTIQFSPEGIASHLGIPTTHSGSNGEVAAESTLKREVQARILAETPFLRQAARSLPQQPGPGDVKGGSESNSEPSSYYLYRFLVPWQPRFLESRNFAVIGAHLSIHATILAQAQALWITAFFQNKIPHLKDPSPETLRRVKYETFYHAEYERLRHPREAGGSGDRYPDLVFDSIPYVDMLLEDMGLRARRKGAWWRELFEPYRVNDYRGLAGHLAAEASTLT